MREIINKNWDYHFYEKNNLFFLSVSCGSVAIFEIIIELNEDEINHYNLFGLDYIDNLAKLIQYSPSTFTNRNIG